MVECKWRYYEICTNANCPVCTNYCPAINYEGICRYEERTITCLNCKHLMFSDMYGECKKQLKIVNPSDTCEYAERKRKEI